MSDDLRGDIATLTARVNAAVIGQEAVVHSLILALLCNGNVSAGGPSGDRQRPALSRPLPPLLGVNLGRIQFTPDLLPADVTGSETYHDNEGGSQLVFEPGPYF